MTLAERSSRLQQEIAAIQERAARVKKIQALSTAAGKLADERKALSALREIEHALVERKVAVVRTGTARKAACDAVNAYKQTSMLASAAADPSVTNPVLNQLRAAISEQRSGISAAWVAYVQSQAPVLNSEVLAVLRGIPSLKNPVSRLERCLQTISAWKTTPPANSTSLVEFDKVVSEAKSTWQQVGGDDLGPDVAQFLQAAASSSAKIESLTPEIADWLKRHNIWRAFRITLISDSTARRA
jgi:hypothetical protein